MIRWWIYLLVRQIIIGTIGGFFLYHNYDKITRSSSIKEQYSQTFTIKEQTHASAPLSWEIQTANNRGKNLSYTGIMGNVMLGSKNLWTSYHKKEVHYKDITIYPEIHDIVDLIIQQHTSLSWWDDKTILYILQQQERQNITQKINDLNFLSKYTHYTPFPSTSTQSREKLDTILQQQDWEKIISYLEHQEDKFKTIINNRTSQRWSNWLLNAEKFAYVYNQLHIDQAKRYSEHISTAAKIFKLEPNLIKACIMVEQLRAFYTFKGLFKNVAKTNTYLTIMSKQSFGIGGIKLHTAEQFEQRLQQHNAGLYNTYFAYSNTKSINQQRLARLTDSKDYYYQVLYSAGILYRYITERKESGYDIDHQPWLVATMYNIGYSKPHNNADIWGAFMTIEWERYSFGWLAMLLYYYLEIYN